MLLWTESLAVSPKKKVRLFRHALSLKIIAFIPPFNLPIYLSLHANVKWRSFENFCRRRHRQRERKDEHEKWKFLFGFFSVLLYIIIIIIIFSAKCYESFLIWKVSNSLSLSLWFYIYFLKRRNELACGKIWGRRERQLLLLLASLMNHGTATRWNHRNFHKKERASASIT